ncbi:LAQU0S20e01024g1_1 [Lachancea quebecensis]|uniref:LAQU0S20e01024g1_1 n=1 Tax=Lachancea quebecensis TaxID=1654605 RepID=A0A0N7MME0_9SACH|nr:LAQU0S20e01024g1_1 [Lachancea quebecensis]
MALRRSITALLRYGQPALVSSRHSSSLARFQYCELPNKSHLHVRGPDAVKFLNGLVTSKLLPTYVKKKLTTISVKEEDEVESGNVEQFDMTKGNWGLFNEVGEFGPFLSRFGTYTGLLNSKGRLLTDAIIYPVPLVVDDALAGKYPEFLVEVDCSISDKINQIFDSHTLVSKVKSKLVPDQTLKTWHVSIDFPRMAGLEENPWISNLITPLEALKTRESSLSFAQHLLATFFAGAEDKILAAFIDTRYNSTLFNDPHAPQVFRVITQTETTDLGEAFNPQGFPFEFSREAVTPQHVRYQRFESGLIDGLEDFKPETLLPLELNFDFLPNAVSFDKGCYVGQELTARTYSTGILRKRAVPVKIQNSHILQRAHFEKYPAILLENQSSKDQEESSSLPLNPFADSVAPRKQRRQRPAGSLLCFEGDRGIAILRSEHFESAFTDKTGSPNFRVELPDTDTMVYIIPQVPQWYEEWLEHGELHE